MTRKRKDFGKRAPPVKTHLPEGLPGGQALLTDGRKRSIGIAVVAAGALAAAGMHFSQSASGVECRPIPSSATGAAAVPGTAAAPGTAPATATATTPGTTPAVDTPAAQPAADIANGPLATSGAIGVPAGQPCPPGTRAVASSSSHGGYGRSYWSWSSYSSYSSSSSTSHYSSPSSSSRSSLASTSTSHSPSVSRGGFGSSGSFHMSGGS